MSIGAISAAIVANQVNTVSGNTSQAVQNKPSFQPTENAGSISLIEASTTKVCCPQCKDGGSSVITKNPEQPLAEAPKTDTCCLECKETGTKPFSNPVAVSAGPPPPPNNTDVLTEATKTKTCCLECQDVGGKISKPTAELPIPEAPKTDICCPNCKTTGDDIIPMKNTAKAEKTEIIITAKSDTGTDEALTKKHNGPNTKEGQAVQNKDTLPNDVKSSSSEAKNLPSGNKNPPPTKSTGDKPVVPNKASDSGEKGKTSLFREGGKPVLGNRENISSGGSKFTLSLLSSDPGLRQTLGKLQLTGTPLIHAQGNIKTLPEALTKTIATLANAAPTPGDRIVTQKAMATIMQSIPSDAQSSTMTALQTISTTAPKQLAQLTQLLQNVATSQPGNVKDIATTIAKIVQQQPNSAMTLTTVMQSVTKTQPDTLSQVSTSLATVVAAAPKEAAALMTSLATVATQSPKATTVATQILSQLALPIEIVGISHKGLRPLDPVATNVAIQTPEKMAKTETSTLTKVATQLAQIATAAPKEAPAIMASISQITEQAPAMTETVTRILTQTAKTEATATQKVAAQLAQLVANGPKESPKTLASLTSIAEQAPKATEAATKILAQTSKSEPTNTPKMASQLSQIVAAAPKEAPALLATLSKIGEQNQKAMTAATTVLANVAKSEPQALLKISTQLSQIALAEPAESSLIFNSIAKMSEHAPQTTATVTQILAQVATTEPAALPKVMSQISSILSMPDPGQSIALAKQTTATSETAQKSHASGAEQKTTIADKPIATSTGTATLSVLATVTQQAPASTAAVTQLAADIASTTPQQTQPVLQALQAVANNAPQSLPQVTQALTQVLQTSPKSLSQVAANVSQIISLVTSETKHSHSASPNESVGISKGLRQLDSQESQRVVTHLNQIIEASPKEARQITAAIAQIAHQDVSAAAKTVATLSQTLDATPKNMQPMMTQIAAHVVPAIQLPIVMSQMGKAMSQNVQATQQLMKSMSGMSTPGQSFGQQVARFQTTMLQLAQFAKQGIDISSLKDFALNKLFGNTKMDSPKLQLLLAQAKTMNPEELAVLVAQYVAGLEEDELDADKKIREAEEAKAAEQLEENKGFTEELYQLFNQQEMDNWASAAYFRMKTKKQAEDREATWQKSAKVLA
jgi:hypothetical protein